MLELIKEDLQKIVKVSDNVQANVDLKNKKVDANFFQHKLFMKMFNEVNNANLVQVQRVYNSIVTFYGESLNNVAKLAF